jgi:hypothetical protein
MRTDKEISELLELHYGIPTDPNLVEELRSYYVNKVVELTPQNISWWVTVEPVGIEAACVAHH